MLCFPLLHHSKMSRLPSFSPSIFPYSLCSVGQINQEYTLKCWATRSSVRLIARTAHSCTCFSLLALLACCAALPRSLADFAHSRARWTVKDLIAIFSVFFSILANSPLLLSNIFQNRPVIVSISNAVDPLVAVTPSNPGAIFNSENPRQFLKRFLTLKYVGLPRE